MQGYNSVVVKLAAVVLGAMREGMMDQRFIESRCVYLLLLRLPGAPLALPLLPSSLLTHLTRSSECV
jgi:hypothetical protein